MNYKNLLLLLLFLTSCTVQSTQYSENIFSNRGFVLLYDESLIEKKLLRKPLDDRSFEIVHNTLSKGTKVRIINLLNNKKYKYFSLFLIIKNFFVKQMIIKKQNENQNSIFYIFTCEWISCRLTDTGLKNKVTVLCVPFVDISLRASFYSASHFSTEIRAREFAWPVKRHTVLYRLSGNF